jgi:hypothetical protein
MANLAVSSLFTVLDSGLSNAVVLVPLQHFILGIWGFVARAQTKLFSLNFRIFEN